MIIIDIEKVVKSHKTRTIIDAKQPKESHSKFYDRR